MVLLITEELHHFYQMLEIIGEYSVEYKKITSSLYAKGMLTHIKTHEPEPFVDKLICGEYIYPFHLKMHDSAGIRNAFRQGID